MAVSYATTTRSTRMSDVVTAVGTSALIRIYAGTVPANVGTALTSQTLLVTLTGNASQFGTVTNGVLTLSAVTSGTAVASGTPTFARILTSGGTAVIQCSAGVGSGDISLASTVASGQTVSLSSGTITEGNA